MDSHDHLFPSKNYQNNGQIQYSGYIIFFFNPDFLKFDSDPKLINIIRTHITLFTLPHFAWLDFLLFAKYIYGFNKPLNYIFELYDFQDLGRGEHVKKTFPAKILNPPPHNHLNIN